jgi:hypothetical protein
MPPRDNHKQTYLETVRRRRGQRLLRCGKKLGVNLLLLPGLIQRKVTREAPVWLADLRNVRNLVGVAQPNRLAKLVAYRFSPKRRVQCQNRADRRRLGQVKGAFPDATWALTHESDITGRRYHTHVFEPFSAPSTVE